MSKERAVLAGYVSEAEASNYMGMSVAWLRRARSQNNGPAYHRVGRRVLYRVLALDSFMSEREIVTDDSTEGIRPCA